MSPFWSTFKYYFAHHVYDNRLHPRSAYQRAKRDAEHYCRRKGYMIPLSA